VNVNSTGLILNKNQSNEIAMVKKSLTEMEISPWLFHTTFKKQIINV